MTDSDSSLGNPFFEEKGNIISRRILTVEPEVQIEYTISLNGTMNGNVSVTDTGTIVSTLIRGSHGIFYSQGQGIVTTKDGNEISIWTSQGIENVTNKDKKSFLLGSAFYRTTSTAKLAFLKNIMTVFKSEIDDIGNISNKEWQWK
jgi:hypothetical protein